MDHSIKANIAGLIPRPLTGQPRREEETAAPEKPRRASPRAALNSIPTPDRLQLLINNALAALRQGIFWDRGAIINIVL